VIRLYSFHAVPPTRLADQRGTFKRFTAEQHELVVADDRPNGSDAAATSQAAALRGLGCEPRTGRAKRRWFTQLCDAVLTGGMTLPQTAAPAVPQWSAQAP
jgi:hypothetical protein